MSKASEVFFGESGDFMLNGLTEKNSRLLSPQRLLSVRHWSFRHWTARRVVVVMVAVIAVTILAAAWWRSVGNSRDEWLQDCVLKVSSGATMAEVEELIGRKPDLQTTEAVVLREGMFLSPENSRVTPADVPETLTISAWKGGRRTLTVTFDLDGKVRSRYLWSEPPGPPSVWSRVWNVIESAVSKLL